MHEIHETDHCLTQKTRVINFFPKCIFDFGKTDEFCCVKIKSMVEF